MGLLPNRFARVDSRGIRLAAVGVLIRRVIPIPARSPR